MSEERETAAGAPAAETPENAAPSAAENAAETAPDEPIAATSTPDAANAAPAPGAPIEESGATETEVLAAVDRAGELNVESAAEPAAVSAEPETSSPVEDAADASPSATEARPAIVLPDELPSAGPSAAPAAVPEDKILVSADHPMAALYMQTPLPPDLRGNRGAGVLISVLATVVFAVLFAALLYFWIGLDSTQSALLDAGLWPFAGATAAFFIGMVLLVVIVGRAGWWAYVLGGFLVGALAWAATVVSAAYSSYLFYGGTGLAALLPGGSITPLGVIEHFGLTLPAIAAGVIAREVTVWFGAWIGSRGRRVSRSNAEAVSEYEAALAEAQAKRP